MSQKVTAIINPKTGEVTYEIEGVMGSKCAEVTAAIIASNEKKESQYTSEYEVPDTLPDYITNPEGE